MPQSSQRSELQDWHREAQQALAARDFRRTHELCIRMLRAAPDFADALFLLGMIALEHGNFAKAIQVIERALRLDPERAEYHAHLGRCFIALNRPREAMEAALLALSHAPRDALSFDTIGVVMTRVGAHAEALEPFRRAVALDATKAAYHYNLGGSLQFSGDFVAAEAAYRDALRVDPKHYKAWSSLAQVRRQPFAAADVDTLQAALAQTADADAQLHLCHTLAKHFEDNGDYARSFDYLVRGKQGKRATLSYAFDADAALFDAARSACSREFLAQAATGHSSAEPIFIVGMPRTGTTLVERILSSHPQVFAAGELTNFAVELKRAAGTPSQHVLDVATLQTGAQLDLAQIGRAYVESTRPRTGRTLHFIDKMPLNFFYAGLIHRALPQAKIIRLRRNALDTCLSNYRQLFATSFSYYNYAYDLLDTGRYYQAFDALSRHWRATIASNYCEVEYESVVADTETQARRLIAFCGLQWDPACLAFHQNAAPVATASSVQVREPIYTRSVERWRKYAQQLEPLRELFGEAMRSDQGSAREPPHRFLRQEN